MSDDEDSKDVRIVKRKLPAPTSSSQALIPTTATPSSTSSLIRSLVLGGSASVVSRMKRHGTPSEPASTSTSVTPAKRPGGSSIFSPQNRLKRLHSDSNGTSRDTESSTSSQHHSHASYKPSVPSNIRSLPMPNLPKPLLARRPSSDKAPVASSIVRLPIRQRSSIAEHKPLSDKVSALGMGTFPQANLTCVRLGNITEFKKPGMVIQFGPDRFILSIDKNITKIPYERLKSLEFDAKGAVKILIIQTTESLPPTSVLQAYYDPHHDSKKAKKIFLLLDTEADTIREYSSRIKRMQIDVQELTHVPDYAEKIFAGNIESSSEAEASGTSKGSEENEPSSQTKKVSSPKPNDNDTLFQFPFQSNGRSKSIAVHVGDMSRLKEGEFLNDTLIEFGLKHVYANLESTNPELAEKTYIFNSFFYERLVSGTGKGISYDSVKSWTNKIDLFSKKYIIIPINDSMHWILAIITNPGLLLKDNDNSSRSSPTQDQTDEPEGKSSLLPSSSAEPSQDVPQNTSTSASSPSTKPTKDETTVNQRKKLRSLTPCQDAEAKPYILVLDSLGNAHTSVSKSLRSYLQQELLARKGVQQTIDSKNVPGKLAKCPQQENFCDCGLFVLHYAEVFLKHPGPLLDEIVNKKDESSKYWTSDDLANKREKYREIMISLAGEYKKFLSTQQQTKNTKKATTGS
ncbi:hypothetical protein B0O80DRAFT_90501 [Mortierella sp. GBAus27b]|nr:hypothetical protein B0O80DRAFT_90501 [Mortierella sp. GBAus27b]